MPNSNFIRFDLSLQPITTQKVMRKAILIAMAAAIMGSAPSDIYAGNVKNLRKARKQEKVLQRRRQDGDSASCHVSRFLPTWASNTAFSATSIIMETVPHTLTTGIK